MKDSLIKTRNTTVMWEFQALTNCLSLKFDGKPNTDLKNNKNRNKNKRTLYVIKLSWHTTGYKHIILYHMIVI